MRRHFLIGLVALAACSQPETRETTNPVADSLDAQVQAEDREEAELKTLLQNVQRWAHSNESGPINVHPFQVSPDTGFVTGIDRQKHQQNLEKLKATGYFTGNFINNYSRIIDTLDAQIKSGVYGRFTDKEVPPVPFAGDVSPWCMCQDYLSWDLISIGFLYRDGNEAEMEWSWKEVPEEADPGLKEFSYRFMAKKENNRWKIDYMEGFDFKRATKLPVN